MDPDAGATDRILRQALGRLPFIAEDLGTITPEVEQLRRSFEMPGMRILQFGFGNPGAHIYLPHRFERNTVVYTGTHDNDTTAGWWKSGATKDEKHAVECYMRVYDGQIHWEFIRAAASSVADLCIIPMQDWLGLSSDCRMNVPSKPDDNWTWRLEKDAISPELASQIAALIDVTDRDSAGRTQRTEAAQEEFAA